MKTMLLSAALLIPVAGGGVSAAELEPMKGFQQYFRTGASAFVYFTDEVDGYHVVTTVQTDDTDATKVFRFTSVVAPGQSVEISVPHGPGQTSDAVVLHRVGNRLMVDEGVKVADTVK